MESNRDDLTTIEEVRLRNHCSQTMISSNNESSELNLDIKLQHIFSVILSWRSDPSMGTQIESFETEISCIFYCVLVTIKSADTFISVA